MIGCTCHGQVLQNMLLYYAFGFSREIRVDSCTKNTNRHLRFSLAPQYPENQEGMCKVSTKKRYRIKEILQRHQGASINHVDILGEGVCQMTILFDYLVKVSTKRRGGQNIQKYDHVIYGCPFTTKYSETSKRSVRQHYSYNNNQLLKAISPPYKMMGLH